MTGLAEKTQGDARSPAAFSETYGGFLFSRYTLREGPPDAIPESLVQCVWYDRMFVDDCLLSNDGRRLGIVSPGWWNRGEGPDFIGAQIEFNGRLFSGDVEIHLRHADWTQHGHHLDSRYNDVLLVVVLEPGPPDNPPVTAHGKRIPTLSLAEYLKQDIRQIASQVPVEDYPFHAEGASGKCVLAEREKGTDAVKHLVGLAGEWRMLNKARVLRERMDGVGADQAVYELFLAACGYSHFKHHFSAIARQLHYERARQLAHQDPMLLEAAFLQVAHLLPDNLPAGTQAVPHYARLRGLRRDFLPGLRPLPLEWRHVGVRPLNYPERRLAGAAAFLARTARDTHTAAIEQIWRDEMSYVTRRRQFEQLFPKYLGFWATHCTWTGKAMASPVAPLGAARIRSIIGNVFVPAGLALARQQRNRKMEEHILDFFLNMPGELENKLTRDMAPRLFQQSTPNSLNFRLQQGLLQIRQDWCETNPSCRNCSILTFLGHTS